MSPLYRYRYKRDIHDMTLCCSIQPVLPQHHSLGEQKYNDTIDMLKIAHATVDEDHLYEINTGGRRKTCSRTLSNRIIDGSYFEQDAPLLISVCLLCEDEQSKERVSAACTSLSTLAAVWRAEEVTNVMTRPTMSMTGVICFPFASIDLVTLKAAAALAIFSQMEASAR